MSASNGPMGLTRWNDSNDLFSYVDLYTNFDLIDAHDHTSGHGVQIPTGGIVNLAVTDTKLANDAVTPAKIPINTLTGDRLAPSTVADTKLASPNNSVWRTLQGHDGVNSGSFVSGTVYGFLANGQLWGSGGSTVEANPIFPWVAAHYLVANKATKLRILGMIATNATAPASNFTLAWNPVTSGGATTNLTYTYAAAVTGSGVTVNTPSASTRYTLTGPEFDPPADGYYAPTIVSSGTSSANGRLSVSVLLQIRHV